MQKNTKILTCGMACLGGIILLLRCGLYIMALDEKNLLVSGHPLSRVLWAVTAVGMVLAVAAALLTKNIACTPAGSLITALGDVLFAGIIGFTVFSLGTPVSTLDKVRVILGYLCVPCLCVSAFSRLRGKPVFFGCFAAVCVFFAVYLVSYYRAWSGDPQFQDYVFAMLTCVTVTLFAYQNTAQAVGIGNAKMWLATGLLTIVFGIAAVLRAEAPLLLLMSAAWALTTILGAGAQDGDEVC